MKKSQKIYEQKGASAVEFALVLPLLLLIIFGIVEWSLYMFNKHIITNASRAGARQGIVSASPRIPIVPSLAQPVAIRPTVINYSNSYLVTFSTPNVPTVEVSTNGVADAICTKSGDDLEVAVSYNYTFLLLPSLTVGRVSSSGPITARTVMQCE